MTDPHYFEHSLGASGEAYEKRSAADQKCIAETGAIIDAGFQQILMDDQTETVLIPGDLVFNGEKESHLGFIRKLEVLRQAGKRIYLTTARHDYNDSPCAYVGNRTVSVEGTSRDELQALYREYGFGQALAAYPGDGLSYVAQLAPGIRLLALNCDGDCADFKGLWDSQMDWALQQIQQAHRSGNYIFAMMHYPLLPGSPVMYFIEDAKLTDWQMRAQQFADAGLDLIFTGHMHMQSLTEFTSDAGKHIIDICTGSFVGCPCAYRRVTFLDGGDIDIRSDTIADFDWDKDGKTAAEYFAWRFDRMIMDIIDGMAYDFDFFAEKFGGAETMKKLKIPIVFVGRLLQRLTVGGLGRLFFFRVDSPLRKRLLKDVGVELVRNVFVGDEPYVKGTPMYAAVAKLMKRLSPLLYLVQKKAGKSNPALQDITAFVLSLIGDEAQRDYSAVLPLKWNQYQKEL